MKKIIRKAVAENHCGECAHGKWVLDDPKHFDMNHKPICLACEFEEYYVLRNQTACDKFKKKR